MQGIKAIVTGIIVITVLGLVNQLVVIMANVAYHELTKSYSFLAPYIDIFTYIVGGVGFAIVMACGGIVTAMMTLENVYRNAIIAALIASSVSLWWSLRTDIFTLVALLFLVFGVIFTVWGSWAWKKRADKIYKQMEEAS